MLLRTNLFYLGQKSTVSPNIGKSHVWVKSRASCYPKSHLFSATISLKNELQKIPKFPPFRRKFSQIKDEPVTVATSIDVKEDIKVETGPLKWKELISIYASLSKFRLSSLVVVTAMFGNLMAPTPLDPQLFLYSSLGTSLAIVSANTFNQYIEMDRDARMNRTLKRILPTGRISPLHALLFGFTTGTVGVTILATTVNSLAAGLAFSNIVLYTLAYTPLKRIHPINTWVGSIVGAIPPMIGWAAATGDIGPGAWVLAALLYVWQIPHFLALSWNLRGDYGRAGYRMLSVVNPAAVPLQTLIWTLCLIPMGAISCMVGMTDWLFALDSGLLGAYLSWEAVKFYRETTNSRARTLFLMTILYLPLFLLLMLWHKTEEEEKAVSIFE